MDELTHKKLMRAVTTSMQESKAWPVVFNPAAADALSYAAITAIADMLENPTEAMITAGITAWKKSPLAVVTQYRAMIKASPLFEDGK